MTKAKPDQPTCGGRPFGWTAAAGLSPLIHRAGAAYSASASTEGRHGGRLADVTRNRTSAAVAGYADEQDDGTCRCAACRRCRPGCAPSRDEVKKTAWKPPDLIASRDLAGGGAAGTVRYAVTSSIPSRARAAGGRASRWDMSAPATGSGRSGRDVVVGREVGEQAFGG